MISKQFVRWKSTRTYTSVHICMYLRHTKLYRNVMILRKTHTHTHTHTHTPQASSLKLSTHTHAHAHAHTHTHTHCTCIPITNIISQWILELQVATIQLYSHGFEVLAIQIAIVFKLPIIFYLHDVLYYEICDWNLILMILTLYLCVCSQYFILVQYLTVYYHFFK